MPLEKSAARVVPASHCFSRAERERASFALSNAILSIGHRTRTYTYKDARKLAWTRPDDTGNERRRGGAGVARHRCIYIYNETD